MASAMAPKRIVFSMIGILGSDVLFSSKHGYYLTRGGRDYRVSFCEKIPHNSLGSTGVAATDSFQVLRKNLV
jgi:hypothetical protein